MITKLFTAIMCLSTSVWAQTATPKTPLGTSEVKRSGKIIVLVYLEPNFKGRAVRLEVPCELNNAARLKEVGIPNDAIMSMKIPAGVAVTLFTNGAFSGKSQTFTGPTPDLGDLSGQASSLKAALVK